MSAKKIIAVVGATGQQGGSVVNAILPDKSGQWAVRALTRDAKTDKAKALAAKGVEVVEADVDTPDSIKKAFTGAYGAFCVTVMGGSNPAKETEDALTMAQAAKEAGLKHVIWSTLDDSRITFPLSDNRMPTLHEKYKVPHFDSKADGDKHFVALGVPTTFLLTSFYWENFIYIGMGPQKGPDGQLGITFPMGDKKMAGIAVADIGKCAFGIWQRGNELVGKHVGIAGSHNTGAELAEGMSKTLGVSVKYNDIDPAVFSKFPFPVAAEMANMFQFYRDSEKEFLAARDLAFAKSLNPELKTWDEWIKTEGVKIPLPK